MTIPVSVVIATRNCASSLQRCIDSISAQSGVQVETIVIDGASADGTARLLAENKSRGAIADYVSEPDSGVYAAFNKGVRRAGGEWITFLGCDDVFHDRFVLRDLLSSASGRVVYGRVNLISASGEVVDTVGGPWSRESFLQGASLPHPGCLHHRSLFETRGFFDESYRIAGDYELLLRELLHSEPRFVDRLLVDMRLGGLSRNPQTVPIVLEEVIRAREAHRLGPPPAKLNRALLLSRTAAAVHALVGRRLFGVLADAGRALRGKPRVWTR
ncbi:MAG: hypothetical protein QOD26_3668 [Betaproteobacteria bacterium]|jgi:glycosyltransferase involved in cell wall biosynthesis|nr:hypothetical protein [Betaproteobacteria bacterium]